MIIRNKHATIAAAAVIIWTYAVTICRVIRWPTAWANTYWLVDYRFGFTKRGFIGSICSLVTDAFGIQMTPKFIAALAAITLCSMSIAMLCLLIRALRQQPAVTGIVVLGVVFASSPFVVICAQLFGHIDALLYFLAIVSVMLMLRGQPLSAAFISSLGILTHETYLFIGLPLVCLAAVAVLTADTARGSSWPRHIVAICIPIAVWLGISVLQSLATDTITLRAQLAEYIDSLGFLGTRGNRFALFLTKPSLTYLYEEFSFFDDRLLRPDILASVGPTLVTIFAYIHSSHRIRAFSPFSVLLLCLVCAPFALHAVAWDTERISTYPIAGGLIAWWILAKTRKAQPVDGLFFLLAMPTLFLNVFGHYPLRNDGVSFFAPLRLLYLPVIAFVITVVVQNIGGDWFREFKKCRNYNKAIDGGGG